MTTTLTEPQPTVRIKPGLLALLRETHSIPSKEQARILGVERSTLHRLETGAPPSARSIAAIVAAFDLTFNEVIERA